MPGSKNASPTFRYFLASLKPLGRVTVWVPLGILAMVGLGLWQYRNQSRGVAPSPLGQGQSSPAATQWIGQEPSAPEVQPQLIDPNTGRPASPAESSNDPNSSGQATNNPTLNSPSVPSNYSPNPPSLPRQTNQGNPPLQNRTSTLFPPLIQTRSNPNAGSSTDNSPVRAPGSSGYAGPQTPFSNGYTPPSQTESPLQRAINRSADQSNDSQPSAPQNTLLPPIQTAPTPSLYSNSYQPPVYQPPNAGSPYPNRGGANYGGNNNYQGSPYQGSANAPSQSQPPAPSGGVRSGF